MQHATQERTTMGRFSVELEIANNDDLVEARRGHRKPAEVRRTRIRGVVDSGASSFVLPKAVAKELGLAVKSGKVRVRYADGRQRLRSEVEGVRVYLNGPVDRDGVGARQHPR